MDSQNIDRIMSKQRSYEYNKAGLEGEQKIYEFLFYEGYNLTESQVLEDMEQDVDCYLEGVATSIKCQHAGVGYSQIGLELTTEHWQPANWTEADLEWFQELHQKFRGSLPSWNYQTWRPSWFLYGKAEQYLIYQGDRLALYRKEDLESIVRPYNFSRVRGLKGSTLISQGGKNTIQCYLDWSQLNPVETWRLP